MNPPVAVPIPRCCPHHRDWATLVEHLLVDYTDVPAWSIIDELSRAMQGGELMRLELPDAIDCVELIVRQRIISATGRNRASGPSGPAPLQRQRARHR